MIFGAFTISTFDGIPLCAVLFRFFSQKYNAQKWVLAQCVVENTVVYECVQANSLLSVSSFPQLQRQTNWQKITKYLKLIYHSLRFVCSNDNMVIYTIDNTTCCWFLVLKKIFFYKNLTIILHQFELFVTDEVSRLDSFVFIIFRLLKKNLDLLIVPEINRLQHFVKAAEISTDETATLLFPNTNNNVVLSQNWRKEREDKIIVGHIGSVGPTHYIKELLAIAPELPPNVEIWFIGLLVPDIINLIQQTPTDNIRIIGQVPHHQLIDYYAKIDIGLILYRDVSLNFRYCAPNKLYEYWSYGIPVVAHQLEGLIPLFDTPMVGQLTNMDDSTLFKQDLEAQIMAFVKNSRVDELRQYFIENHDITVYLNKLDSLLPD